MVKEGILYLKNYNKENDVALFPGVNFFIWMSWPCGVLTCRASYAFHVGKQYRLWTETLTFSQIRNFSLTCCLSTMVKRHSKATRVAFLFGTGARVKTLIQGTLGRLPFNNFSLISKLTLKSSRFGVFFQWREWPIEISKAMLRDMSF